MKQLHKILIFSLAVLAIMTFNSCQDYLDVNTDPTKVSDPPLKTMLPVGLVKTSSVHYSTAYSASQAAHQMDHTNVYFEEFSMGGAWSTIYLSALNNLKLMVAKAADEKDENGRNSPFYGGIGKVLEAVNLGMLTSCWEDAPWSEALQGEINSKPSYDSQEDIYKSIFTLLDEAIVMLNTSPSANFRLPGGDDLSYGGDIESWKRLAYSLKARYQSHVMKKMNIPAADILSNVDSGFVSNDQNFTFPYSEALPNPWFTGVSKPRQTGNFSITTSKYMVALMNGDIRGAFDPRLPVISPLFVDTTLYIGESSWDQDDASATCALTVEAYHAMAESPMVMMTYAELKFIEAEVAMNSGNTSRAYDAYIAGITANMEMLGVDGTDYLSSAAVAQDPNDLTISQIMVEKYIANFLNTESWNDIRRYGYSSDVYTGFTQPDYTGRAQNEQAQRALYPSSEKSRNEANYVPHIRDFTEKMWRDK